MSIRNVRQIGDEILRKKSKIVTKLDDRTKILIDDMIETMNESNGVGLAAVQVGILKNIIVVRCAIESNDDTFDNYNSVVRVFINPEFIYKSEEENTAVEGCLSVSGKVGEVKRSNEIKIKAKDENFNDIEFSAKDYTARIIQHEMDHLIGVLYVDKIIGRLYDDRELIENNK